MATLPGPVSVALSPHSKEVTMYQSKERVERDGYLVYAVGDQIPDSDVDELRRQGFVKDTPKAEKATADKADAPAADKAVRPAANKARGTRRKG